MALRKYYTYAVYHRNNDKTNVRKIGWSSKLFGSYESAVNYRTNLFNNSSLAADNTFIKAVASTTSKEDASSMASSAASAFKAANSWSSWSSWNSSSSWSSTTYRKTLTLWNSSWSSKTYEWVSTVSNADATKKASDYLRWQGYTLTSKPSSSSSWSSSAPVWEDISVINWQYKLTAHRTWDDRHKYYWIKYSSNIPFAWDSWDTWISHNTPNKWKDILWKFNRVVRIAEEKKAREAESKKDFYYSFYKVVDWKPNWHTNTVNEASESDARRKEEAAGWSQISFFGSLALAQQDADRKIAAETVSPTPWEGDTWNTTTQGGTWNTTAPGNTDAHPKPWSWDSLDIEWKAKLMNQLAYTWLQNLSWWSGDADKSAIWAKMAELKKSAENWPSEEDRNDDNPTSANAWYTFKNTDWKYMAFSTGGKSKKFILDNDLPDWKTDHEWWASEVQAKDAVEVRNARGKGGIDPRNKGDIWTTDIKETVWYTYFLEDQGKFFVWSKKNMSEVDARALAVANWESNIKFHQSESAANTHAASQNQVLSGSSGRKTLVADMETIAEVSNKRERMAEWKYQEARDIYDNAKETLRRSARDQIARISAGYQKVYENIQNSVDLTADAKEKITALMKAEEKYTQQIIVQKVNALTESSALKTQAAIAANAGRNAATANIISARGISDPNMLSRMASKADTKTREELNTISRELLDGQNKMKDEMIAANAKLTTWLSQQEQSYLANVVNLTNNMNAALIDEATKINAEQQQAEDNVVLIENTQAAQANKTGDTQLQQGIGLETDAINVVTDLQTAQWKDYITWWEDLYAKDWLLDSIGKENNTVWWSVTTESTTTREEFSAQSVASPWIIQSFATKEARDAAIATWQWKPVAKIEAWWNYWYLAPGGTTDWVDMKYWVVQTDNKKTDKTDDNKFLAPSPDTTIN